MIKKRLVVILIFFTCSITAMEDEGAANEKNSHKLIKKVPLKKKQRLLTVNNKTPNELIIKCKESGKEYEMAAFSNKKMFLIKKPELLTIVKHPYYRNIFVRIKLKIKSLDIIELEYDKKRLTFFNFKSEK